MMKFKYYKIEITSRLKDGSYETFVIDFKTDKGPADLAEKFAKGRYGAAFDKVVAIEVLEDAI